MAGGQQESGPSHLTRLEGKLPYIYKHMREQLLHRNLSVRKVKKRKKCRL